MIYLAGCVFYLLLRGAAYVGTSAHQRKEGVKDNHKNPVFMADLVYTFTGQRLRGSPSDTSRYRDGKSEGSINLPFNDQPTISAYNNKVTRGGYSEALDRMKEFTDWHLNPEKQEWLIRALLDIIVNDESISETDMFYVQSNGTSVSKRDMSTMGDFEYQPFLVGVLHYILTKRAGKNSLSVSTLDAITVKIQGQERKYVGHLGEELTVKVHEKITVEEVTREPERTLVEVEAVENPGNRSQGMKNDGFDDDDARKQFFERFDQFFDRDKEIMIGKNINKIGYIHTFNQS